MEHYNPPFTVINNFQKGLTLYNAGYGGKGLVSKTISDARHIVMWRVISKQKLIKMRAWFARHDKAGYKRIANPPSPGYVAYLLWGGAEGRKFAQDKLKNDRKRKA